MFQRKHWKLYQLLANGKCSTALFKDRITFLGVQISDCSSISFESWLLTLLKISTNSVSFLYPFALICVGIHILLNTVASSSYCCIPPSILHKLESLSRYGQRISQKLSESSWFSAQVFYSFNLWLEGKIIPLNFGSE